MRRSHLKGPQSLSQAITDVWAKGWKGKKKPLYRLLRGSRARTLPVPSCSIKQSPSNTERSGANVKDRENSLYFVSTILKQSD